MKILTWNINGIRAAGRGRSLKDILDSLKADIICLQETKVTRKWKILWFIFRQNRTSLTPGFN